MSASIIITGNVGKDLETFSFGQGGEGFRFDIAVTTEQRGEQTTRWYKVACFGRVKDQAKQLHEEGRLVQGAKVLAMGSFIPRDYTTRNGETKVSFDVTATSIEVLHYPQRQQQAAPDDYEAYYAEHDDEIPNF